MEKRKTMLLFPIKYTANVDSSCPAISMHTPPLQIREEADSGAYIFVVDEYVNSHTPRVETAPVSQIHNWSTH